MTVQCCKCHRVRNQKGWEKPIKTNLIGEATSHTYCPSCYAYFRLEMEKWKRRRSARPNHS